MVVIVIVVSMILGIHNLLSDSGKDIQEAIQASSQDIFGNNSVLVQEN